MKKKAVTIRMEAFEELMKDPELPMGVGMRAAVFVLLENYADFQREIYGLPPEMCLCATGLRHLRMRSLLHKHSKMFC
jgi:hypothetical protein